MLVTTCIKILESDTNTYQENKVFKDLDKYISFYKSLPEFVMMWHTHVGRYIFNIDTYVYSSMQRTLESIKTLLQLVRLGDAFALLRKYHDSIVLNPYTNLRLENLCLHILSNLMN